MEYRLTPATPEDAEFIAAHARQSDIDELLAVANVTPLECLLNGIKMSPQAYTGWIDGERVCMFGVSAISVLTGFGVPWMVGTDAIDRHAIAFIKGSRSAIRTLFAQWGRLYNLVDARNTRAVRWLRFLGFTIEKPIPYGVEKLPFHPFHLEVSHV